MFAVLLVSTTAACTPWNFSLRRYLLLAVMRMLPLPSGPGWSYVFDHVSPGFTALSGRTADTIPFPIPTPNDRSAEMLVPLTLTTRPSAAICTSRVGNTAFG